MYFYVCAQHTKQFPNVATRSAVKNAAAGAAAASVALPLRSCNWQTSQGGKYHKGGGGGVARRDFIQLGASYIQAMALILCQLRHVNCQKGSEKQQQENGRRSGVGKGET